MEKNQLNWSDDLLEREADSRFLYKLVMQRLHAYHADGGDNALCFALDAPWGAGKTFFVDRWSNDLEAQDHATLHFDAWANDLSDDPLIGFIASLRRALEPWLKKQPLLAPEVVATAQRKMRGVFDQAKRAALPAAGALVGAIAKRYAGDALAGISEAWSDSEPDVIEAGDAEKASAVDTSAKTPPGFSKAADRFLEMALKSHTDKQNAISELKKNIEGLILYLVEQKIIVGPLFIFIDELDRCRPDYAIKLLEGIKHIFNARGVCFVVSTNIAQLSCSIKAVYGSEFDAHLYLKKFFSFEYFLPEPDFLPFARSLFKDSLIVKEIAAGRLKALSGLPDQDVRADAFEACSKVFAVLSEAHQLSPRSQRQVFEYIEASLAALESRQSIVLSYLFFLAGVRHKNPAAFAALFRDEISTGAGITSDLIKDSKLQYWRYMKGDRELASVGLVHTLSFLHEVASFTQEEAINRINSQTEMSAFPESMLRQLITGGSQFRNGLYLDIATTGHIIKRAGFVK